MSRSTSAARMLAAGAAGAAIAACAAAAPGNAGFAGIGRAATPAEIAAWDIDVRPDFKGLPPGSGSVAQGEKIWDGKCASCHGTFGESNEVFTPLVGGTTKDDIRTGHVKSLEDPTQVRTTFMKVSTISTLWDYIRRAMPWNAPKSLSTDEVYAVLAYLLNLADIVPNDFVLSNDTMGQVQARLPNRNGMVRDPGLWDVHGKPDVRNVACMHDCPVEARVVSSLPQQAEASHGNLADQNRIVGPVRGEGTPSRAASPVLPATGEAGMKQLASETGCLACHALDHRIVGPGFNDVARRYGGQKDAESRLVEKVRHGGSGEWGSVAMPPHPGLSEAHARDLVRWILHGAG